MHELGIVFHIIRGLKEVAEENNVTKITRVTLEIGEVSSIVPDYLIDCYKWAIQKEPLLIDSELVVDIIGAVTHCEDCGNDYETVKYGKECPHCHSKNTYLICGLEANIKSIEY